MKFECCNLTYSTRDLETYWCIEKFLAKTPLKKEVGKDKVTKELIYILTCKISGCIQIKILRYGLTRNKLKVLESEHLMDEEAEAYYIASMDNRIPKEIICPVKHTLVAKNIPWTYPKVEDEVTQRRRYLNEQDYADKFLEEYSVWTPDIFKSKVKIFNTDKVKI